MQTKIGQEDGGEEVSDEEVQEETGGFGIEETT
jgi:hypothetical protein